MKHPEVFSDEAVLKRSQKAAQELAVASRSAKVKRELDNARLEKKEQRPLKEFTDFRTEIAEHVGVPAHSMPPNILILRRKTIRQFPNNVMVALYYNDKLGQYFSIPYGSNDADDAVITPVALKENEDDRKRFEREKQDFVKKDKELSRLVRLSAEMNKKPLKENGQIQEDAISHLQKVKAFATDKPLYHKDGSQTKVDPTTAHALLTVHGALHPDNRKKFADALEHSQPKFHKMLSFAWKQVK
jgi:hypothetical protein